MKPSDFPGLQKVLEEMSIPEKRRDDVFYLLRNVGIIKTQQNHPKFYKTIDILKTIARHRYDDVPFDVVKDI